MRTLFLSALFTIGFALPSTLLTSCCDCESTLNYFDIRGVTQPVHSVSSSSGISIVDSGQVIDFDTYTSTIMNFNVNFVANNSPSFKSWELNLMGTANALSCDCDDNFGSLGAKTEALAALSITVLDDFNSDVLAGDVVTSLFDFETAPGQPDLLENPFLEFTLNTKPDNNNLLRFRVDLILSSGENYSATTSPVGFE